MSLKNKLIDTFGISNNKEMIPIDRNKLFAKSGITVIAALAGEGKTTKMLEYSKDWEDLGYTVSYINFDTAPTYGAEMIESPNSQDEVEEMISIIEKHAIENDIIIIDSLKSLASYSGLNIENNEHMYSLMLELRTLIKKTGCSIIIVHHVFRPKNLKSILDSFYGSRAIEEQSDSGFMFYKKNEVEIVKSRLGYTRGTRIQIQNR